MALSRVREFGALKSRRVSYLGCGRAVPVDEPAGAAHQTGRTGLVANIIRRRYGLVASIGDVLRRPDMFGEQS